MSDSFGASRDTKKYFLIKSFGESWRAGERSGTLELQVVDIDNRILNEMIYDMKA